MDTPEKVKYEFAPQKTDAGQQQRILNIEVAFTDLAQTLLQMVPPGKFREATFAKLLIAKHLSVHAISHPGTAAQETKKEQPNAKKEGK